MENMLTKYRVSCILQLLNDGKITREIPLERVVYGYSVVEGIRMQGADLSLRGDAGNVAIILTTRPAERLEKEKNVTHIVLGLEDGDEREDEVTAAQDRQLDKLLVERVVA